jgi:hypothetical protein
MCQFSWQIWPDVIVIGEALAIVTKSGGKREKNRYRSQAEMAHTQALPRIFALVGKGRMSGENFSEFLGGGAASGFFCKKITHSIDPGPTQTAHT